jgi:hypothetical protein
MSSSTSRRRFLASVAYAAPAVTTLSVMPRSASAGSKFKEAKITIKKDGEIKTRPKPK